MNGAQRPSSLLAAVKKLGFTAFDKAIGVCALNEALFRRSAVHKRHHRYTWADIALVDPALAGDVQTAAQGFGFTVK